MKLPALLYGCYKDVKRRSGRLVTALAKGAHWADLAGDLVDTQDLPGLIVVSGPSPLLGGADHFHCFAPVRALRDAVPERIPGARLDTLSEELIATNWGILGLLGQAGYRFLHEPEHHVPFLRAVLQHWDEMVAVGPRYTTGTQAAYELWSLPTCVDWVLAQLGNTDPERPSQRTEARLLRRITDALDAHRNPGGEAP